jgi:thioredoxin reductase (NADPH)
MYDILIIGGGPAGLSAAIYAARAQLKTAVFGDYKKGNLYKAHLISNYLGFPKGISGADLCATGLEQAKSFGAEHLESEIVDIKINDDLTFTVKDDRKQEYASKTLILATGQSFTLSGIKNERELTGKGVSYCVTCDGFFFKGKNVVVIGSGNYAGEEALQLLAYTKNITVLSHGKDFTFSEETGRELAAAGIKTQKTVRIKEISGAGKAEKLVYTDGTEMPVEGVFMAAGVAGATAFAKKLGLEINGNYIRTDNEGKTNIKGIFAAGDCTGSPAQVASSVGAGCNAALSAIKLLRGAQAYVQYG